MRTPAGSNVVNDFLISLVDGPVHLGGGTDPHPTADNLNLATTEQGK